MDPFLDHLERDDDIITNHRPRFTLAVLCPTSRGLAVLCPPSPVTLSPCCSSTLPSDSLSPFALPSLSCYQVLLRPLVGFFLSGM